MTIGSGPQTRGRLLVCAASLLFFAAPTVLRAEPSCAQPSTASEPSRWPSPLDRLVTLHSRDLPLRDALDRLAAAARLRLSYASELLSLDRCVCVSYDSVAAGAVLSDLLDASAVTPFVAGDDQVVLTPTTAPRKEKRAEQAVNVLDRVVVTGSAFGAPERGLATAVTIIDRAQ